MPEEGPAPGRIATAAATDRATILSRTAARLGQVGRRGRPDPRLGLAYRPAAGSRNSAIPSAVRAAYSARSGADIPESCADISSLKRRAKTRLDADIHSSVLMAAAPRCC